MQFSLVHFLQNQSLPIVCGREVFETFVLSSPRELIVAGMSCSDGGGSMSDFARLQARGTGGESLHGPKSHSGGQFQ